VSLLARTPDDHISLNTAGLAFAQPSVMHSPVGDEMSSTKRIWSTSNKTLGLVDEREREMRDQSLGAIILRFLFRDIIHSINMSMVTSSPTRPPFVAK